MATQIFHLDLFEMLPILFIRIQVRRVGRELLQVNISRATSLQKFSHQSAAVNWGTIPDHQQLAANPTPQVEEERDTFGARQRLRSRQRIESPFRCNPAHHRQVIARDERMQDRRLTSRRVGPDHAGQQIKTGFVYQDDVPALMTRFFLSSFQVSARHCVIFPSSRWRARSIGFCGVQSNSFKSFGTWWLWYETPNSNSITRATRAAVQTSPRKPYASAPWDKNSGSSCFCSEESFGVAPLRGRARNPLSPYSCTRRIHWLTAPFVTPKASAISSCVQPSRLSSSARHRRCSFQSTARVFLIVIPAFLSKSGRFSYQCVAQ